MPALATGYLFAPSHAWPNLNHFDSSSNQARSPSVSADKPRIHSTETTLDFHAPADFRFFFDDTGATMRLSDLEAIEQSVANMIQGAQARVLGSCGDGAAINEVVHAPPRAPPPPPPLNHHRLDNYTLMPLAMECSC